MLLVDGAGAVLVLALWVYALLDVITSDEGSVRNLPKWAWLALVLLLGELAIGPVLWFLAGRPRRATHRTTHPSLPAQVRPRRSRPAGGGNPDDDEDFLRSLREQAQRERRDREQQPPENGGAG